MRPPAKTYLKAILLVAFTSFIGVWFWYGAFIQNPGIRFNESGDGLKNYYTVEYHVLYDSTAWHFQGMNYPYGDNVIFTDNQPILANILRFVQRNNIADLKGKIVPIMNLLMLFGIVLCALFVCLIFMEFDVVWWYAALCGAAVSLLSPQLQRFIGHYSLAYTFYIPLFWFAWIRYFKSRRIMGSIFIALIIVIASFVHLYYLPMALLFGAILWLFYYFKYRPQLSSLVLNVLIQLIMPFLIVKLWLLLTDSITDRPTHPYGFTDYRAFWEGVFLPVGMQIGNFISTHIMPIRPLKFENYSYVGLAADIFMGVVIFRFFKKLFTWKWKNLILIQKDLIDISFIAGFMVLLFSLGLPFLIHPQWLNYMGPMQQFRSVGRFAWVFFYVINVCAFVWYFSLWQSRRNRAGALLFIIVPLFLTLYDDFQYNRLINLKPAQEQQIVAVPFNKRTYQAILPLPFFFIGGEGVGYDDSCNNIEQSENLSLETGLPLVASNMSRTSRNEVLKNIAFAKDDSLPVQVINEYKSNKPILVVVTQNCPLSSREKQWVSKGVLIGNSSETKYYTLSLDSIKKFNMHVERTRKHDLN